MIKLEELRIGNLVLGPKGDVCKVFYIDKTSGKLGIEELPREYVKRYEVKEVSQIPLDEEWLIKAEFKFDAYKKLNALNAGIFYEKEGFKINREYLSQEWKFIFNYNPGLFTNYIEVKHVHQLQNLYFLLQQVELAL